MYFGADYYPEQWVFPFAGTAKNPEAQWEVDAKLMVKAGKIYTRILGKGATMSQYKAKRAEISSAIAKMLRAADGSDGGRGRYRQHLEPPADHGRPRDIDQRLGAGKVHPPCGRPQESDQAGPCARRRCLADSAGGGSAGAPAMTSARPCDEPTAE